MEIIDEINNAIETLKLNDVKILGGNFKGEILQQVREKYVNGDPRAWWLSLKEKPKSYVFNDEHSYRNISQFFDDSEKVYFIVDEDDYIVIYCNIQDVINIIGECSYFEYYIVDKEMKKMLCENDHNEFLFIDQ